MRPKGLVRESVGSFGKVLIWIGAGVVADAAALAGIGGAILCENALHPIRRTVAARSGLETVTIRSTGGLRLAAWFLRPAAGNGGCVMILHGIGDTRAPALGLAPMFLEKGYAVLLPDSRGHGDSAGEAVSYGVTEKWDVIEWTVWLRAAGCRNIFGRVPLRQLAMGRRRPDRPAPLGAAAVSAHCGEHSRHRRVLVRAPALPSRSRCRCASQKRRAPAHSGASHSGAARHQCLTRSRPRHSGVWPQRHPVAGAGGRPHECSGHGHRGLQAPGPGLF